MSHFKHLSDSIQGLASMSILDIGSGGGEFVIECALRGARVVGVEYNQNNVEKTLQKARSQNIAVDVRSGAAENLPVSGNEFEFVNICEVIEHVEDPGKMLDEVHRVLKPDGKAYLSVPNRYGLKDQHFHLWLINWMPRSFSDTFISIFGKHKNYSGKSGRQRLSDMHYFTYGSISRLLSEKGFDFSDMRLSKLKKKMPLVWPILAPLYYVAKTAVLDSFHILLVKKP